MAITKHLTSLLLISATILFVSGCELINPAEPVPSYIEIDEMSVSSNYPTQGTNSSDITDVWVYADNKYLGTFELPAKFPVLLDGVHEISFGAGIEANGIASTNEAYPLYQFTKRTVNLQAGKITKLDSMNVSYFSGVQYVWYEDFESDTSGGGISLDTTNNSEVNILPDSIEVFEGKRSLKLTVNSTSDYIECVTVGDGYALNKGRDTYLEMNYKCTQSFNMGLVAISSFGQSTNRVITFNPKSEWNKIYIRLGPYINASGDALKFKIIFGMQLASGVTEGTVYLDNLKLITN
mgnify:CR=1 FL=1